MCFKCLVEKEIIRIFSSKKFQGLLLIMVFLQVVVSSLAVGDRTDIANVLMPLAFIAPLLGGLLGYDTISREHEEGTFNMLMSQQVTRLSFLFSKYVGSFIALSLALFLPTLAVFGFFASISVYPLTVEMLKTILESTLAVILSAMATFSIAMLFSSYFKNSSASLSAFLVYLVLNYVLSVLASFVAEILAGPMPKAYIGNNPELFEKYQRQLDDWNLRFDTYFSLLTSPLVISQTFKLLYEIIPVSGKIPNMNVIHIAVLSMVAWIAISMTCTYYILVVKSER